VAKRGPKPRDHHTTTGKGRRNVSLTREEADALNLLQQKLEALFGFAPTLSQTLAWLIQNAVVVLDNKKAVLRRRNNDR
jgi:hypothetical protein